MDVKFNVGAATRLISDMNRNCNDIVNETRELLNVKNAEKWKDSQSVKFSKKMDSVANELNIALRYESEYLETYRNRVVELSES